MYNFTAEYEFSDRTFDLNGYTFMISLHDATAEKIIRENDRLVMEFPQGFTVFEKTDSQWHTYYTDRSSRVIFDNFDTANAYTLEKSVQDGEPVWIKHMIELRELMDNVNSGRWQLEIINEYLDYMPFFQCDLRFHEEPYSMGCELELCPVYDDNMRLKPMKISYCWNRLFPDE